MTHLARSRRSRIEASKLDDLHKKSPWLSLLRRMWPQMDRRGCRSYWSWGRLARSRMRTIRCFRFRLSTSTSSLLASLRFSCEGESAIASSWFVSCFMTITPAEYQPGLRVFNNLSAMLCFAFVAVTSSSGISTQRKPCQMVQQQRSTTWRRDCGRREAPG